MSEVLKKKQDEHQSTEGELPSLKEKISRRDFLIRAGTAAAALSDPFGLLEALATEKPKQGIRAHGLDYNIVHREGVRLHIVSFNPDEDKARIGVHYTPNRSTPLKVARNRQALAVINGTFYTNTPLGCVAVDRNVLYEAPMSVRRLNRGVLYIRADDTISVEDFREKHELVDLADPKADFSRLNIAEWEVLAIENFRKKHGFKKVEDIFHVGLPEETLHRILDDVSVGVKSEVVTKTAQEIINERVDISDLLGGG